MTNIKKKKNKNFFKQGLTLLELMISIAVISIFIILVSLLSNAILKNFSQKNEYQKAYQVKEVIISSIRTKLSQANMVQFAGDVTLLDKENNEVDIKTKDFYNNKDSQTSGTPLEKYNAVFSKYGKIYTINSSFETQSQIVNISDIPKKGITNPQNIKAELKNNIPNIIFERNNNLNSLFPTQLTVFFPNIFDNKKYKDPYDDFEAFVTFSTYYAKKVPIGIVVNIKLKSNDNKVYFFREQVELFNLKNTKDDNNYILPSGNQDTSKSYGILYYYKKDLRR